MPTVSLVELQALAQRLAPGRFDEPAARGLGQAYEEFVARRRRAVAPIGLEVDGRPYPSLYAVLADPTAKSAEGVLRLAGPAASPTAWEFLTPFERIEFHADGTADLHGPDGAPPRHGVARVLLREHFVVRSRAEETGAQAGRLPGFVGTVEQGVGICRALGALPFGFAFLLYLGEERARFEIDVVHGELLMDPRAGRLAAAKRVRRTARIAWGLDRTLGRGHLSLLAGRALEVLTESNGLTSIDLAHVFGGARELVDSALQALVQQRLVTFDPRTGIYRARIEAFLPPRDAEPPVAPARVRPELRSSVQELLAAAEAKALCPLCGQRAATGPSYLLCDECAGQVGLG